MSSQMSVLLLVLIISAVNLTLAMITVRGLAILGAQRGSEESPRVTSPTRGAVLTLNDSLEWPDAASRILYGDVWVAFVVPGCLGCHILREEFESYRKEHPPLIVIGDPGLVREDTREYLDTTWTNASASFVAPTNLELLEGLGPPDEFPTLLALRDGVVLASAHRLRHLIGQLSTNERVPVGAPSGD